MSKKALVSEVSTAILTAAARTDVPVTPVDAQKLAAAVTPALPNPIALESLWPQLVRYALYGGGIWLVRNGMAAQGDVDTLTAVLAPNAEMLLGLAVAIGTPLYRIGQTVFARIAARR